MDNQKKWGGRANGTPPAKHSNHTTSTPRVESVSVLVVLHPDGYVEVFGPKNVDAHLAVMPAMPTAEGEVMAEEYITLAMPPRHRSVYMPGLLRTVGNVRTITPSDIADRDSNLALIRSINAITADQNSEVTTWTL